MNKQKIEGFYIIGIAIRTSNENGQSEQDIPALWHKFINEGIANQIPNKLENCIYCIYTDYEKDHTKPYTTILGCKVSNLNTIPYGMITKVIDVAVYEKYVAKGNILEGIVLNEWMKIWNSALDRSFTADFEVYSEKAQNPKDAEIDIFVAIK